MRWLLLLLLPVRPLLLSPLFAGDADTFGDCKKEALLL